MGEFENLSADLVEIQSQLAFQEDTIATLDRALTAQQQELIILRRQLALLGQRLDEQGSSSEASPPALAQERPPHY